MAIGLSAEERIEALERSRDEFKAQLDKIEKDVQGVKKLGNSFASALKKFSKFESDLADLRRSFNESEKQQRIIVETQEQLVANTYQLTQVQDAIAKKQESITESQMKNEKSIKSAKRWIISLLVIIAGLFLYIAIKSPATAKDLAEIVSKSVVQAIQ